MPYYQVMRVVIFTGGVLRDGRFVQAALKRADLVMAADSGGRAALEFGVTPSVILGDFDSLDAASKATLKQSNCEFISYANEKDLTDTELTVQYAIEQKATHITVLGGVEGDRLDHIMANIFFMLAAPVPIKFTNGLSQAWVETGPATVSIAGQRDDLLSLIPLTPRVTNVVTNQLKYHLDGATLQQNYTRPITAVSNVLTKSGASVTFSEGALLLVHTVLGNGS